MMRNFWIVAMVLIVCRLLSAWIFPTFDDAFITYRYAINFASGHGLVYNVGERVMGTTAPLFAFIAYLPTFLGLPIQKFFVFFNVGCDVFSLYIAYTFIFKNTPFAFLALGLLFAGDPMINRVSVGGMEANLFLAVSLSGLIFYQSKKKVLAFILLSAIYFLRPEAGILVFILLCYDMYTTGKLPVKYAVISLLVVSVPIFFIYSYYGQALPQSIIAKSTMGRESLHNLIRNIFFPDPFFYIYIPLAIYGFIKQFSKNVFCFLLGIWAFCFGMAYIIKGPFIWSWYPYSIEFSVLVLAAIGLHEITQNVLMRRLSIALNRYQILLPLAALPLWIGLLVYKGRSGVEANVYQQLEKDFTSDTKIRKQIIFADDIGAIGYFTKAYMYDDLALITPRALQYKTTVYRIINSKADYLFIYADPNYINMIKTDSTIGKMYSFYKRYSIKGEKDQPVEKGEPGFRSYSQDYVLFKRN
jgi:hypothetical protein